MPLYLVEQIMTTESVHPASPAATFAAPYDAPIYQKGLDHVWIHTINYVELAERQGLHIFERGEGCTLYDARGEAWIDALAGLWVVNVGHGRREIAEAMAEQASKLAYVSSAAYTSVPA